MEFILRDQWPPILVDYNDTMAAWEVQRVYQAKLKTRDIDEGECRVIHNRKSVGRKVTVPSADTDRDYY